MKKLLFISLFFTAFIFSALAQKDTVVLKNGKTVSGFIYKMEDGKIYISTTKDSAAFTANDVQTIMFCHSISNCCGESTSAGNGYSKGNSSDSKISSSYSDNPCIENNAEQGIVIFTCNMCGGVGSLLIKGENGSSKSKSFYTFTLEKDESFFQQVEKLFPGNYIWEYKDSNNNVAKGKFVITKGEEKKIVLFEKH